MAWVAQKELTEAVIAMEKLSDTLMSHSKDKLKIKHPAQQLSRGQWENLICTILATTNDHWDVVMPENSYVIQGAIL